MKKFFFSLLASLAMLAPLIAGETYRSSNERQQVAPECPQWYADTEFNLTLSGAYGMTANSWHEDAYLGVDHAWGASIEAKYFFRRYFAVGVQGTLLWVNDNETFDNGFVRFQSGDKDRHTVGTMLGTFTVRIPINCSRFAPYGWVGGGGILGGGRSHEFLLDPTQPTGVLRREFHEGDAKTMAQAGGGFEVRLTPNVGWTSDFSWNIVSGSKNNFGLARTGINFAF